MLFILFARSCSKVKLNFHTSSIVTMPCSFANRSYSEERYIFNNRPQFSNSTLLIENGSNMQELPVLVRKLNYLLDIEEKPQVEAERPQDSLNFHMIKNEFNLCSDLKDVFSLLSKCSKITPNIALGAMERIYDLEKDPDSLNIISDTLHTNLAKGAILDKLLKVVMKTEDTQTILNILNTSTSFMEPYKYMFSEELMLRVVDNKLSVEHLCQFVNFLIDKKHDPKYLDIIDKLWVGFVEKESEITELNILQIFSVIHGLKVSKKTVLTLLEQKFSNLWHKINAVVMQEILDIFIQEKILSMQSYGIVGRWLNTDIHLLDEDSLLNIVSKLTRLNYNDKQIERAVEKYMTLKGSRINSIVFIVGVMNYCMQFHICNKQIMMACSNYILKCQLGSASFLKSLIYPFGFLCFDPLSNPEFWDKIENLALDKFEKLNSADLCSIILAYIYVGKYPMKLIHRAFSPEYLCKLKETQKIYLIDTAMSLDCKEYSGPLLPKDQWPQPIAQDKRIKNIICKTIDSFLSVAGGAENLSTAVLVPNLCSDETFLLDVVLHPAHMGSKTFNWKTKCPRNETVAILIHLPDHYCNDNEHLIGPQVLKKRLLKILGLKVVSLKYSVMSYFYTSCNTNGLRQYLSDSIKNAEPCAL